MRPGEVCQMRTCDIDTTGKLWIFKPAKHKTDHLDHERVVYIGPKAQEVLAPYLKPDLQAFIFCPAEAVDWWRQQRHDARTTPLSCGNVPGSCRKRRPKREAGERYDVASYRRVIARACDEAFAPPAELARLRVPGTGRNTKATRWETPAEWEARLRAERWGELRKWRKDHRWHPHQLRHNAATRLRKQYGLEAARVVLGHRSSAVAEVYAEIDQDKARQIMGEVG
jgi:integrase